MTMKEATTFATAKLAGIAVAMFAFGFALVPLYEIYCQVTGANGKTGDQYQATEQDRKAGRVACAERGRS